MLLNSGRKRRELSTSVDTIHNYYERVVLEQIAQINERARSDPDFFADVACVALNRLPPRYIRYDVDMTFFMSPIELAEMYDKVEAAVKEAIDYVTSRDQARAEKRNTTTN